MLDPRYVRARALGATLVAAALVPACGGATPTAPGATLTLTFAVPIQARLVPCPTCVEGPAQRVVAEFPVTVADPSGPGGQVERVEVLVFNRSRGVELGRNTRPNKDFPYADTLVPAGGSLVLEAGIVFDPPSSGDQVDLTVRVSLADGRDAQRTAAIAIAAR